MTATRVLAMDATEDAAARFVDALRGDTLRDEPALRDALTYAESRVHDRPDLARYLAALCIAAADRYEFPAISAQGHYVLARILAERGELDLALASIDLAHRQWERAGELLKALRTNLGRMQVLDDLGRHADAVEVGRRMLAALDEYDGPDRQLRDELRATAWNNLGVAHSFLGDHQETIDAYAAAEDAYEALGLSAEAAKTRGNRGIELLEVGRAREALAVLTAARQQFADMGDRMWDAKCRGNIAQAHVQLGETVAALRELAAARITFDELQAGAEAARLQATGARLYLAAGLHGEARGEAAAAAQFLLGVGMQHDAAAASLTYALSALVVGDLDAAEPWLARAKDLFVEVGDRQAQALVTLAEADAAAVRDATAEAAALAARAADELRDGGWLIPLTWAVLRQADLATDPAAVESLLAAAEALVDELRLPQLTYAYLLRRAEQARSTGDLSAAEDSLRAAAQVVERLGATLSVAELRTAFRDDHLAAHDALVDVLVRRGAVGQAAGVADRAKARTLSDLVAGTLGERWRGGPDAAIAQLRADLSSIYHAMREHADRRLYASLQSRAAELERKLTISRLEAEIRQPAERAAAPGAIGTETSAVPVLSYHLSGDDVIVFVASGQERTAARVPGGRVVVDEQLDQLNGQWSRFALGPQFARRHADLLLATSTDSLRRLSDVLVAPVREVLDAIPGDDLVIVPHRRLHQVPFGALHDGANPLAAQWSITLAPTAAGSGVSRPVPAGELAVFAVADDATPAIADEARAVSSAWPAVRSFVGADATSAAFRAAHPGPAAVHVACHAQYRHANPMFSALRLADRWVTASELLELDFGGALVTLSACETGRHGSNSAEPVGLAWAFLAAGASGVVVSQWLVDDEVTAQLMTTLYRGLAAGRPPAAALRAAQLETAERHPHPYYWAPFSYVSATHDRNRT